LTKSSTIDTCEAMFQLPVIDDDPIAREACFCGKSKYEQKVFPSLSYKICCSAAAWFTDQPLRSLFFQSYQWRRYLTKTWCAQN